MTEWQILKDGTTAEPNLVDVEVHKTADPFASYGIAYIRDPDGTAFDEYYRGRRVDFESAASAIEDTNLVTDGGNSLVYTSGPAHGEGGNAFKGATLANDGRVIFAPLGSTNVGIFDPSDDSYTSGPAHGEVDFSFRGATTANDGRVIFAPYLSDNVGIFDPSDDSYTSGPAHGDGGDAFAGAAISSDGRVIFAAEDSDNVGIFDPSDDSYTSGPAHGDGSGAFWGATTANDGRVVFAPRSSTNVGIFDPSDDSYTSGPAHGEGDFAFNGATTANDGRVIFAPLGSTNVGIFDPSDDSYTSGPAHGEGGNAFRGATTANDGRVIFAPYGSTNVGILEGAEGIQYEAQQTCFVVERREIQRNGHDMLEVECWSIDHLLNRNVVTEDISDTAISSVLETLVTDYTPVGWDASKVEVFNDVSITRSFEGMRTGAVIQELAAKSANEQFGVDLDGDFYFQSRETGQATRNISNSQWFDYDIFELGQESVNEAQINYDSGNATIVYDDAADKQFLQNELSTAGPVTLKEEQSWDQITSRENAIDKATEIVEDRSTTLTGTVTTFGLLNSEPGNVINVTIDPISVNDTFRIAELAYYWARDETIVTILEKRENQTDDLIRLNDRLTRTETRTADRTVTPRRVIIPDERTVSLDLSGIVDGQGVNNVTATTSGLSLLSGLWVLGDANNNHDVTELRVGTDSSEPTTTDDSISSVGSGGVSLTNNGVGGVTASASVSISEDASIVEVGLFAQDLTTGTEQLIARGTFPAQSVSNGASISVSMTINYETASGSRGVFTETAQSALSDLLSGDVTATVPQDFVWGNGTTDLTESSTSLNNTLLTESIVTLTQLSPGVVLSEHTLQAADLSGFDLTEFGTVDSAGNLLHGTTFAPRPKPNDEIWDGRDIVRFTN